MASIEGAVCPTSTLLAFMFYKRNDGRHKISLLNGICCLQLHVPTTLVTLRKQGSERVCGSHRIPLNRCLLLQTNHRESTLSVRSHPPEEGGGWIYYLVDIIYLTVQREQRELGDICVTIMTQSAFIASYCTGIISLEFRRLVLMPC